MTKRITLLLAVAALGVAAPIAQARRGADDNPATHDVATTTTSGTVADDNGGDRPAGVSDDPANHDATDDKGGQRAAGVSDDDPATHDVGDDKGGQRPAGSDDKATPAKKTAKAKKKAKRKQQRHRRHRGRRH